MLAPWLLLVIGASCATSVRRQPGAPELDPGPRTGHVMVYDSERERSVVVTGGGPSDDVWYWDGKRWSTSTSSGPGPRSLGAAAFDARRGEMVLYGGVGAGDARNGDVWEWNGSRWRQTTDVSGGTRDHHAMAYDAARRVTVAYGGLDRSAPSREQWKWISHVSEWNGREWNTSAAPGPGERIALALAYDARARHVLLFGGGDRNANNLGDTWAWNGSSWSQLSSSGPPARRGHAMAFDGEAGVVYLFGGVGTNGPLDDMWRWDGLGWHAVDQGGQGPGKRFGHTMAYDARRRRTVLFGGFQSGRAVGDVWEWSGGSWARIRG